MITERIGSYFLFVQGFRGARLIDSERVLRDLRGSFGGIDLQLLRGDRVAGVGKNIFLGGEGGWFFLVKGWKGGKLSVEIFFFSFWGEHNCLWHQVTWSDNVSVGM